MQDEPVAQEALIVRSSRGQARRKAKRDYDGPTIRQEDEPNFEYEDILGYSWAPLINVPMSIGEIKNQDYIFPELSRDPTWVYQIGEGTTFTTHEVSTCVPTIMIRDKTLKRPYIGTFFHYI